MNIDIPNKQNTTHSITTNPLVLNGLQIIKLNHDFWNTLFFKTPATFGPHFPPPLDLLLQETDVVPILHYILPS